jgi:hypothetical protein
VQGKTRRLVRAALGMARGLDKAGRGKAPRQCRARQAGWAGQGKARNLGRADKPWIPGIVG